MAYGIADTQEVLRFGFALAKAFQAARADGVIDLRDLGLVFPLFQDAQSALSGLVNVPKELGDLSDDEMTALMEIGKLEFPMIFEDKEVLKKVEKGYALGLALAEFLSVL